MKQDQRQDEIVPVLAFGNGKTTICISAGES